MQTNGIEVWAAFKDIHAGRRWPDELEKAAASADWFVILARPDIPCSQWQDAEWRLAVTNTWNDPKKRILPVVFGKGKLQPFQDWVPLHVVEPLASPGWLDGVVQIILGDTGQAKTGTPVAGPLRLTSGPSASSGQIGWLRNNLTRSRFSLIVHLTALTLLFSTLSY